MKPSKSPLKCCCIYGCSEPIFQSSVCITHYTWNMIEVRDCDSNILAVTGMEKNSQKLTDPFKFNGNKYKIEIEKGQLYIKLSGMMAELQQDMNDINPEIVV